MEKLATKTEDPISPEELIEISDNLLKHKERPVEALKILKLLDRK